MANVLLLSPSFFSLGGRQRLMQMIVRHSEHDFDVVVGRSEYDADRAEQTCVSDPPQLGTTLCENRAATGEVSVRRTIHFLNEA